MAIRGADNGMKSRASLGAPISGWCVGFNPDLHAWAVARSMERPSELNYLGW